jgi:hypothetical protein
MTNGGRARFGNRFRTDLAERGAQLVDVEVDQMRRAGIA